VEKIISWMSVGDLAHFVESSQFFPIIFMTNSLNDFQKKNNNNFGKNFLLKKNLRKS
jgi:hypothetical protein